MDGQDGRRVLIRLEQAMEGKIYHITMIKTITDAMLECSSEPNEDPSETVCIALAAVSAFMLGKSGVNYDFEALINIATAAQNSMAESVNDWIHRQ